MPNFRRSYTPGGTYFFTAVTHERRAILTTDLGRRCLREAIAAEQNRAAFELFAIVLLPDHLHTVWVLPEGDADYSTRWRRIKTRFTRQFLKGGGEEGGTTRNRLRHQERAVWQHRFWEHTVRDEDDLQRCVDYVHWNPVKHGLVERVRDYPWSTFARFVESGDYPLGWGTVETPCPDVPGAEWE
jgi:putative transposase